MANDHISNTQYIFNTGILYKENRNYNVPKESGKLKKISFYIVKNPNLKCPP